LSHLWSLAEARPWNDHRPDAYMRLVRGSAGFVGQAAEALLGLGAASVVSPPLTPGPQSPWRQGGFDSYVRLRLLSRSLGGSLPDPSHPVSTDAPEWGRLLEIDEKGFGPDWCASRLGLEEALRSTSRSILYTIKQQDGISGFAICAAGGATGYIQRIAVHPDHRRHGIGRSLLAAGYHWMRRGGARRVLLNTKPENDHALEFYRAEGFALLPDRLELLRYG
jgi:ribosomal protein S18 acetylase RimI-like enzyme